MGLYGNAQTLWLGTRYQLWRFENMLPAGQFHEGYDRLYVPRIGYTTGDLDIHDIAVEDSGRVVFAATACNCLATLSPRRSFQPLWLPPFISKLATEDRCHLNGLALRDGKARYVTAVSSSDVVDGWRDRRTAGGCVIDVTSGDVVAEGLSMPHSPRWYRERLWVLNSGKGEFGWVDLAAGRFEPIAFCPGYLRGLAFAGDHAIVSLSQPRHDKTFGGLPLDDELARKQRRRPVRAADHRPHDRRRRALAQGRRHGQRNLRRRRLAGCPPADGAGLQDRRDSTTVDCR